MVNGDDYVERVISVMRQFDMVRKALVDFRDSPARLEQVAHDSVSELLETIRRFSGSRLSGAQERRTESRKPLPEDLVHGFYAEHESVKQHFREVGEDAKNDFVEKARVALNRVNQNELILMVALFESQMKEIHRGVLRQAPALLKSDRQVSLGRLISDGAESLIELEIEREAQSLDRKSVKDRAAYFHKHLGLEVDDAESIRCWEQMVEARNELLHGDCDKEITDSQLKLMHAVVLLVPFRYCEQCAKRYPKGFSQWEGWLTTDWSSYNLDGAQDPSGRPEI
jgi:hypothetical protein